VGGDGDRLPFSPKFSANLAVTDEFAITDSLRASLGATLSHVGERVGNFLSDTTPRQTYPGYTRLDLQAGLMRGPWGLRLYARNVTNSRGLLYGGLGTLPDPVQFQTIQPRTVGFNITRSF
jgi:hypothetical protein